MSCVPESRPKAELLDDDELQRIALYAEQILSDLTLRPWVRSRGMVVYLAEAAQLLLDERQALIAQVSVLRDRITALRRDKAGVLREAALLRAQIEAQKKRALAARRDSTPAQILETNYEAARREEKR